MNVQCFAADRLTAAQIERWSQIQAAAPELQSPFFHPLYSCEAAAALGNVEVAVLEEEGEPAGFFPFQRTAGNVGVPVGGSLNDFQGVVARPEFTFDAAALVRDCGLSGLRFTQLLASQPSVSTFPLAQQRFAVAGSPRGIRGLLPPSPRGRQHARFADP